MPDNDIRLLALDGGGVRGLSSLMILQNLMSTIDPDSPPKPCDYFDMICGTSTGGLIAIMLGRLRMTVDECITAYTSLSDKVFEKKSHRVKINGQLQGRFDTVALEQAVKQILVDNGHGEDALLKDPSKTACKVFVCATSKETGDTVCLTSYRPRGLAHLYESTKIWQACQATSAATTFFDPIAIGPFQEQFVDGALGANNPVYALWNQAQDVWADQLRGSLRCLVSIGTGVPALRPVRDDILGIGATLKKLATETETTAEQFRRDKSSLDDEGRYYRFNVARGLEDVGLEESRKQREIAAATGRYVASQDVFRQMKACANGLARKHYFGSYKTPFSLDGVPASSNFVDRPSDTADLEKYLLPRRSHSRQTRKVFVLHGLGGVGKTQLAIDFARRHQATFSSVFWLDGRSEDRLRGSIAGCVNRIPNGQIPSTSQNQTEAHSKDDLDAAVASVMEWLARPDNGEWLLIFDNVDQDHEQGGVTGAYDLRRYLPGDHGAILVTTRLSRLAQLGESRRLAKVDLGLSKAIFKRWYGSELGSDCDQLLELLDGLPLALAQAASYLREKGVNVATYVQIYKQQWDELMGSRDASSRPLLDYEQGSIATTWMVSFKEIESKSTDASSLLRLWAFLDNKQLWHGLLGAAAVAGGADGWPDWLREMARNVVRFLDSIGLLLRYSMIETQEGSTDSYSMHPVVHRWASFLDGDQQRHESARLALVVVGSSVPTRESKEYWVFQQKLLPHAERCTEWMQEALSDAGVWYIGDELVMVSLHMLGVLYSDQGKFKEAEEMCERALEGHEKALGSHHPSTLNTVNSLGSLYNHQGKLKEAEEMYKRALEGKEKALGPHHPSTLSAVNNLGSLYNHQGKFKEAEEMYERALEGREKALGSRHTSTLNSVHYLGILYNDQDKFKEAEEMYERALEGCEKALGPHHTSTLSTVNNLGALYKAQGKFKEAEEVYKRALEGYEKALGSYHTSTLNTVNNLGNFYKAQGKFKEAEEMYERALHGFQTALGPNHPKSSMVMRNIESLQRIEGISISTNKEAKSTGGPKALGRLAARIRGIVKPRRVERPNESTQ
ncbi:tetratricopeptide repeat domain protein [Ilyonectria robusta]